jgi:hypothetical protein
MSAGASNASAHATDLFNEIKDLAATLKAEQTSFKINT